jgi:hypothetical protein
MAPDRCVKAGRLKAWLAAGLLLLPGTAAAQDPAAGLAERADGAERVVVGRVTSVNGVWQKNEFGDRLIVSVVRVAVEETLKGEAQTTMELEVEGGTIGDLTLHVSDITPVVPGDRAVFYVRRSPRGVLVPHRRGLGLLKLDRSQRVAGSNLTLDEVRRAVRSRGGR